MPPLLRNSQHYTQQWTYLALVNSWFLCLISLTFIFIFFSRSRRIVLPLLFITFISTQICARPHYMPSLYAHPAVLENDAAEDLYPSHLRNPFYKTPRVRQVLSKFSWFGYGEQPVFNRIADAIPRREIYKLMTHSGLAAREHYPYA